jgi:hypothetical protein
VVEISQRPIPLIQQHDPLPAFDVKVWGLAIERDGEAHHRNRLVVLKLIGVPLRELDGEFRNALQRLRQFAPDQALL